jgi:hypothetical protein
MSAVLDEWLRLNSKGNLSEDPSFLNVSASEYGEEHTQRIEIVERSK